MPTPGVVRVERRLDLTFRDALVGTHSVGAVANAVAPAERVAKAIGGGRPRDELERGRWRKPTNFWYGALTYARRSADVVTGEHMDEQLGRRDARVDRKESLRFDYAARLLLDLALEGVEEPFSQLDLSTRKLPAAVDDSDEEDIPLLVGDEPAHGKYVRRMVAFGHRSVVPTQIRSAGPSSSPAHR